MVYEPDGSPPSWVRQKDHRAPGVPRRPSLPSRPPEALFIMKFFTTFSLFGALAAALPTLSPEHVEAIRSWDLVADNTRALEARQSSDVRNELQTGGTCPPVILIWARGSTEEGNMVCTHSQHPLESTPHTHTIDREPSAPPLPTHWKPTTAPTTSGSKGSAAPTRPPSSTTSSPTAPPPPPSPRARPSSNWPTLNVPRPRSLWAGTGTYFPPSPAWLQADTLPPPAKEPRSSPRPSATAPPSSGSKSRAPRSLATPRTSRTRASSPTTPPAVSPSTAPSATASARARSSSRPHISSTLTRRRARRPSSCLQELRRAEEGAGALDGCAGTRWAMKCLVDDFVMIFMYYGTQHKYGYLPTHAILSPCKSYAKPGPFPNQVHEPGQGQGPSTHHAQVSLPPSG